MQVGQRRGVRKLELGGPARQREPRRTRPVSHSETSTPLATATAATVKACEHRSGASAPAVTLITSFFVVVGKSHSTSMSWPQAAPSDGWVVRRIRPTGR